MCGDPLPSDPGPWSRDCEGAGSGALHQNGSVHLEVILGLLRCIVPLTVLWSELVLGRLAWSSLDAAWLVSLFLGVIGSPKRETEQVLQLQSSLGAASLPYQQKPQLSGISVGDSVGMFAVRQLAFCGAH